MNETRNVQDVLAALNESDEVLGAIAVSAEGLVMGIAGIDGEDADMLAALGASLVGVAERTMRRLGSRSGTHSVSIGTGEGSVQIWARGDIALIVLTEPTHGSRLAESSEAALDEILGQLVPA